MSSEKQTAANRRNSLKSTGPQTDAGKKVSRWNALRHGLCAREILIPGEDGEALEELRVALVAALGPEGPLEEALLDRIAASLWRLRRAGQVEAGLFVRELTRPRYIYRDSAMDTLLAGLGMTEVEEDGSEAEGSEAEKRAEVMGLTFSRDGGRGGGVFTRLARYETSIERSLYRALHELQRLQEKRGGGNVPPPLTLDVDVSLPQDP